MRIPLTEAEGQLAELARRAEAGDEIVLTREGGRDVRLMALTTRCGPEVNQEERLRLIHDMQRRVSAKGPPDTSAARSQDFLYDEYGIPK